MSNLYVWRLDWNAENYNTKFMKNLFVFILVVLSYIEIYHRYIFY